MSVLKRWNGTSWEVIGPQISSTRFDDINHMIAPEYSSADIYNVGDYVVQSDKLYKCISAIESAEEWTVAHWIQVDIGSEISDLNDALQYVEITPIITAGAVGGSTTPYSTTSFDNAMVKVRPGDKFRITATLANINVSVVVFKTKNQTNPIYISNTDQIYNNLEITVPNNCYYMYVNVSKHYIPVIEKQQIKKIEEQDLFEILNLNWNSNHQWQIISNIPKYVTDSNLRSFAVESPVFLTAGSIIWFKTAFRGRLFLYGVNETISQYVAYDNYYGKFVIENDSYVMLTAYCENNTLAETHEPEDYVIIKRLYKEYLFNSIEKISELNNNIQQYNNIIPNTIIKQTKNDVIQGSLQANGTIITSYTSCFSSYNRLKIEQGEKLLFSATPIDNTYTKIRIVLFNAETGSGYMDITETITENNQYEYIVPDNYSYLNYCFYYYNSLDDSSHSNILSEFEINDIVANITYLDKRKQVAFEEDLEVVSNSVNGKAEEEDLVNFIDSLTTEQILTGNSYSFIEPAVTTKIIATENVLFTGRNLKNVMGVADNSNWMPTINNRINPRSFWGSDNADITSLVNTLPAGTYTFSVEFLIYSLNSSYTEDSNQQLCYITINTPDQNIIGEQLNITNNTVGDIIRASVKFELDEDMAGHINYIWLYSGYPSNMKFNFKIASIQIEQGNLTEPKKYQAYEGTQTIAYDNKMSIYYNGNYSISYSEISITNSETMLPDYFQTEVDDCIAKLENYCTDKAYTAMIVTDSHIHNDTSGVTTQDRWKDTIKNMTAVHKAYQIDSLLHLGDMVNGSLEKVKTKKIIRMIRDDMRSIVQPNFILVGNHDTNTFYGSNMDEPITEAEMYGLWERYNEKDITSRPGHLPYWYKDYDPFNMRIIYLSSSMGDGTHGGRGENWGYPLEEQTWFRDVALNTNKQVLCFSHMPFTTGFISDASSLPQYGEDMKQIVINFISNGGIFIGLINGHTHFDLKLDNGNFTEISLGAQTNTGNTINLYGTDAYIHAPEQAVCYGRIDGTVTQDLWSILVVKPDVRECKIIRFGAGEDISWNY